MKTFVFLLILHIIYLIWYLIFVKTKLLPNSKWNYVFFMSLVILIKVLILK